MKIPPEAQKAIVLGAAQSQGVIFEPLSSELSAEDLTKVLSGELALSFYGEIRYCDVFRQRHLITCSLTLDDNIRSFRIDHYDTSVTPPAEWQSTNAKK